MNGSAGTVGATHRVGRAASSTTRGAPKRFYWTSVRPLPRFSGPAARIGTEVHRWIERRRCGQAVSCSRSTTTPDLTSEELAGEPGQGRAPAARPFLGSRFADVAPLHAERPFLLRLERFDGGRTDRRRSTASPTAPWEVVDWKTGRRPARRRPARRPCSSTSTAWRASRSGAKRPEDVTLTLPLPRERRGGHRSPMEDPDVVKARVVTALRSIDAGAFDPTPAAVHALRLPRVLSGGQGVAGRGRERTPPLRREPFDLLLERPVARRAGRSRPRCTPGTKRAARLVSAGMRAWTTARNHSRSPGWIEDLADVPMPPVRRSRPARPASGGRPSGATRGGCRAGRVDDRSAVGPRDRWRRLASGSSGR